MSKRIGAVSKRIRGFSLVELMVAITLGLLVTGAVISVFVGSHSAYQSTTGVGALTDGGRFALNYLQASGRGAGYLSCNHTTVDSTLNNLNWAAAPLEFDFRFGVGGFEAVGTGPTDTVTLPAPQVAGAAASEWTTDTDSNAPSLDPEFTAATAQQVKGSDILVLRSSLPGAAPVYASANTDGSGNIDVYSLGSPPLQVGQLAAIADCTKAVVFQISGAGGGVVSFGGPAGLPGNALTTLSIPFAAGALLSRVTTTVYYIGMGADGDTALRRLNLNGANGPGQFTDEELVPDIENMQVLYGVDTNGVQAASQYVTADQVSDFNAVMSVKVALLAASPPGSGVGAPAAQGPFTLLGTTVNVSNDSRVRRVFDATITLRDAVN